MDIWLILWCSLAIAIAISNIIIDSNLLSKALSAYPSGLKDTPLTINNPWMRVFAGSCFYVFDSIVLAIIEIVIPIIALSQNIGIPIFAWISLALCTLLTINGIVKGIQYYKKRELEIAAGKPYTDRKLSPFYKIVGLIPDVYILYILLITINVIK